MDIITQFNTIHVQYTQYRVILIIRYVIVVTFRFINKCKLYRCIHISVHRDFVAVVVGLMMGITRK